MRLLIFEVFLSDSFGFFDFFYWNLIRFFDHAVRTDYQGVLIVSLIPKSKQAILEISVLRAEFPNIFGQFLEKFGVVGLLRFVNVGKYFSNGLLLNSSKEVIDLFKKKCGKFLHINIGFVRNY